MAKRSSAGVMSRVPSFCHGWSLTTSSTRSSASSWRTFTAVTRWPDVRRVERAAEHARGARAGSRAALPRSRSARTRGRQRRPARATSRPATPALLGRIERPQRRRAARPAPPGPGPARRQPGARTTVRRAARPSPARAAAGRRGRPRRAATRRRGRRSRHTCLRPGRVTLPAASFIFGPSASSTSLYTTPRVGASALVPSWVPTPKASIGRARGQQRGDAVLVEVAGRQDLRRPGSPASSRTARDRTASVGQVARVEAHAGDRDALARQLVGHLGRAPGALDGVVGVDQQHDGLGEASGRRPGRRRARRRRT